MWPLCSAISQWTAVIWLLVCGSYSAGASLGQMPRGCSLQHKRASKTGEKLSSGSRPEPCPYLVNNWSLVESSRAQPSSFPSSSSARFSSLKNSMKDRENKVLQSSVLSKQSDKKLGNSPAQGIVINEKTQTHITKSQTKTKQRKRPLFWSQSIAFQNPNIGF